MRRNPRIPRAATNDRSLLTAVAIPYGFTMVLEYESQHLPEKSSSFVGTYEIFAIKTW